MIPRSGQAVLSLIFVIGTVIVLAGATLAFVVVSFLNASLGYQAANRALAVAAGGVQDGLLQLARNKDFSATYTATLGTYAAQVNVAQNVPVSGRVTITSDAIVLGHERKVQAIIAVDQTTSNVSQVSWGEVAL